MLRISLIARYHNPMMKHFDKTVGNFAERDANRAHSSGGIGSRPERPDRGCRENIPSGNEHAGHNRGELERKPIAADSSPSRKG